MQIRTSRFVYVASRHLCSNELPTLFILERRFLARNVHGSHNVAEFCHALGVATLIVVPGVDLNQRSIYYLRRKGIDNATACVVGVIRRDERLGFVTHDSSQRTALTGLFQGCVNFFSGHRLLYFKDAISQTSVEQRDTNSKSIEFPLEFGVNLHDGRRATGGCRAEVLSNMKKRETQICENRLRDR